MSRHNDLESSAHIRVSCFADHMVSERMEMRVRFFDNEQHADVERFGVRVSDTTISVRSQIQGRPWRRSSPRCVAPSVTISGVLGCCCRAASPLPQ